MIRIEARGTERKESEKVKGIWTTPPHAVFSGLALTHVGRVLVYMWFCYLTFWTLDLGTIRVRP